LTQDMVKSCRLHSLVLVKAIRKNYRS
jgi:hypothetical protein